LLWLTRSPRTARLLIHDCAGRTPYPDAPPSRDVSRRDLLLHALWAESSVLRSPGLSHVRPCRMGDCEIVRGREERRSLMTITAALQIFQIARDTVLSYPLSQRTRFACRSRVRALPRSPFHAEPQRPRDELLAEI
jgi:hypothetical protein